MVRSKLLGIGLLGLALAGCASSGTNVPITPVPGLIQIQAAIQQYHAWLQENGFLLRRQGRFAEPRGPLDPETGELLPPEPGPTPEEIKEMLKELMDDPTFHKIIREHERGPIVKMPAGSPSPLEPVHFVGGSGDRAVCIGDARCLGF